MSTPDLTDAIEQLARDICSIAQRAGMPEPFWGTDSRIGRACAILDITPSEAHATDWYDLAVNPGAPRPALANPTPPSASRSEGPTDVPANGFNPPAGVDPDGPMEVWTDGACKGNPGPGGWGWVTADGRFGSGSEPGTTNQRMEILAAYQAVTTLTERPLVVVSDSTYVVNCFQKRWWKGWLARDWKNSQGQPVANRDLWEPFIDRVVFGGVTADQNPNRQPTGDFVTFRWVKGHANWPLNEEADRLAVAARETLPDEPSTHRKRRR